MWCATLIFLTAWFTSELQDICLLSWFDPTDTNRTGCNQMQSCHLWQLFDEDQLKRIEQLIGGKSASRGGEGEPLLPSPANKSPNLSHSYQLRSFPLPHCYCRTHWWPLMPQNKMPERDKKDWILVKCVLSFKRYANHPNGSSIKKRRGRSLLFFLHRVTRRALNSLPCESLTTCSNLSEFVVFSFFYSYMWSTSRRPLNYFIERLTKYRIACILHIAYFIYWILIAKFQFQRRDLRVSLSLPSLHGHRGQVRSLHSDPL